MSTTITQKAISMKRLLPLAAAAALTWAAAAHAAAPGITGTSTANSATFHLTAADAFINQPDGNQVYSWGYGCAAGSTPDFVPHELTTALAAIPGGGGTPPTCSTMQIPGPTLVVTEGQTVTVTLTNSLPTAAGNTSILFPGFNVSAGTTAAPAGGASATITSASESGNMVTITAANTFAAGDQVTVTGVTAPAATIVSASADASGNVTITTTAPTGFTAGTSVTVALTTASSPYSGTFTIATVPTATTFTYLDPAAAGAAADTGGGTATGASAAYNGTFTITGVSSTTFQYTVAAIGLANASGGSATVPAGAQINPGSGGVVGLLTQEAAPGGSVTYTFVASAPGTHAYYSGTQGDLQIEMGMYGALIVLPSTIPTACTGPLPKQNMAAQTYWKEPNFRLANATGGAGAAYNHAKTCYDREYLFQWSEMDLNIHRQALAQVTAKGACTAGAIGCKLEVPTEPYHPGYFLINGRSMPDDMDPNYDGVYPHQPYNGNPHMHPGEQVLLRVIGQGRWQHPFHEHANHVRILARDGNLVLTPDGQALAGLLMFNTDTTPGQAFDGIFYFSGRGLNWDMFGHNPTSKDPLGDPPCTADAYGYNTGFGPMDTTYAGPAAAGVTQAVNYYEWCQDHNKPVEANPFGDVPSGGPATLPNPNIFANGAWYGGTPYFGPDATLRADTTLRNDNNPAGQGCVTGTTVAAPAGTNPTPNCSNLQPSNIQANPANERGWAFMWHSHNEREITTNNVFPGGQLMMMLVDSREFVIDESQ